VTYIDRKARFHCDTNKRISPGTLALSLARVLVLPKAIVAVAVAVASGAVAVLNRKQLNCLKDRHMCSAGKKGKAPLLFSLTGQTSVG